MVTNLEKLFNTHKENNVEVYVRPLTGRLVFVGFESIKIRLTCRFL